MKTFITGEIFNLAGPIAKELTANTWEILAINSQGTAAMIKNNKGKKRILDKRWFILYAY